MNFETSLNELEGIIEKMESGQLSLEASFSCFEQGIQIARRCQQALKEVEQKVQLLMEQNGELQTKPFVVTEGE